MKYTDIFKEPDKVLQMVYDNGGFSLGGYGILSGGFGGGVRQEDFHTLIHVKGVLDGICEIDRQVGIGLRVQIYMDIKKKFKERMSDDDIKWLEEEADRLNNLTK